MDSKGNRSNGVGSKKRFKSDGSRISSTTIPTPCAGVFVTCVKGKERQAGREIKDIFESLSAKLWPVPTDSDEDEDEDENSDLEEQILKEKAKIAAKATNGKQKKRIVIHFTDTPCLLFVACAQPVDPVKLTVTYLEEVKETGIATTRAVQRLEPITSTCVASLPELVSIATKILPTAFGDHAQKYKIICKIRNNQKLTSAKIIEELPGKVPAGNSVSLDHPDLVIFVVVYKSIAGLSVLPKYDELKKFNVSQLVDARDLDEENTRVSKKPKTEISKEQEQPS